MKDSAVCLVRHQGPRSLRLRPDAVSSRLSEVLGSEGCRNTPQDISTDTAERNTARSAVLHVALQDWQQNEQVLRTYMKPLARRGGILVQPPFSLEQ